MSLHPQVFKQSYIPRTLDEVVDFERDMKRMAEGVDTGLVSAARSHCPPGLGQVFQAVKSTGISLRSRTHTNKHTCHLSNRESIISCVKLQTNSPPKCFFILNDKQEFGSFMSRYAHLKIKEQFN